MIQLGDSGPYVRAWQRIVGAKADGVFGPGMDHLVQLWQAARGIEPDGVIGPLTRAAVDACALIQAYEGLVLQAYDDHPGAPLAKRLLTWEGHVWRRADGALCMGYPTVGWGTRIWPGQEYARERCTRAQADQWLQDFVTRTLGPYIAKYLPAGADATQRAALLSLGYNGGPGAIVKAEAARFDLTWWCDTGPYVMTKGVRDAGLVMRRAEEAALWAGA